MCNTRIIKMTPKEIKLYELYCEYGWKNNQKVLAEIIKIKGEEVGKYDI